METISILAKSEPPLSLHTHIEDCLRIYYFLKECFPNAGSFRFDGVDFWSILHKAIIFHDLGKAHKEFQNVLRKVHDSKWYGQRHELFSIPFVPSLDATDAIKNLLMLVIAGHHKAFDDLQYNYLKYRPEGKTDFDFVEMEMLDFYEEFKKVDVQSVSNLLKDHYQIHLNTIK